MIRNVVVEFWTGVPSKPHYDSRMGPYNPKHDAGFQKIGNLKSLRSPTILVNEKAILDALIHSSPSIEWHSSLGYGPQINMRLLNFSGMTSLRSIRGLCHLEFLEAESDITQVPRQLGSMEGGFLEITIKREVMLPRSEKL